MNFVRRTTKRKEVNLIPLINVIFLLLIFFMVAGTVEGIEVLEVYPPHSSEGVEKPIVKAKIYLGKDGKIAVNNDIVREQDFETIISTLLAESPEQSITIKADSKADAKKLIYIMNIIEKNGGEDISLITQKVS